MLKSTNYSHLAVLQTTVPILAKFLQASERDQRGRPSDEVCNILLHISEVCQAPFLESPPSSSRYAAPTEDVLSLFPSLPKLIGTANYSADTKQPKRASDSCRKESYSHPSLCPGIFTIFCHHSVCYGFQVMDTCKSQKHPFKIFRSHFETAPSIIIYDNVCKLHQYCLNREPQFFRHTLFAVDRFHLKGHVGCSSGYCLDTFSRS